MSDFVPRDDRPSVTSASLSAIIRQHNIDEAEKAEAARVAGQAALDKLLAENAKFEADKAARIAAEDEAARAKAAKK